MISWFQSVWPLVSHVGLGSGLIAGLLAAAYFSPILKKDFLYAAIVVAVGLFIYGVGVHDEKVKRDMADAARAAKISRAVQDAINHPGKDPWDDPKL